MNAVARADQRIRSHKSVFFRTRGSDSYDHKGLKKALRSASNAIIAEQLDPGVEYVAPMYRWVVRAWFEDGDKSWLDEYVTCLITSDKEKADAEYESHLGRSYEDGYPYPPPTIEFVQIPNSRAEEELMLFG